MTAAPARYHEVTAETADAGVRLDRLLADRVAELSRSRVKALVEAGQVSLGGVPVRDPAQRVKPGQIFAIIIPEAAPAIPRAQAIALAIVYEDDDLIVIDKPAGMTVHPAPGHEDGTLVNALIAHCGASLSGIGGVVRPGIVHRLDKDTSGLMVAAKTDAAHRALSADLAARRIERLYQAVVWGTPKPAAGEIAGDIGRHPKDRQRMAVVRGGKPALTRYRLLRRLGRSASLVECRLATGRTHQIRGHMDANLVGAAGGEAAFHQIRVHMAAIGHPIVGDPTYTRETAARAAVGAFGRQALHAYALAFDHPRTRQPLRWEIGLPNDIKELVTILEVN